MPQILDQCVLKVMKTGKNKEQAYAICTSALQKAGKLKGSVFPQIDLIKAAEANGGVLPTMIHVLPVGEWKTQKYPEPIKITAEIIDQMITNFHAGERPNVPIDTDHDEGSANGWITDLVRRDDGMWAQVDWTPQGVKLLSEKTYRFFSPEFSFDFRKPLDGKRIGATFLAGTLTNRPLFTILEPIVGNEGLTSNKISDTLDLVITASDQNNMNAADILKTPVKDRKPEEVAFLEANKDTLTADQKTQLETEAKGDAPTPPTPPTPPAPPTKPTPPTPPTPPANPTPPATPTEGNEGNQDKIDAAEYNRVKTMAEEATKKLKFAELKDEFNTTYVCSDSVKGKILPKGRDAMVNFLYSLSEEQRKLFDEVYKAIPDVKVFGELGNNESPANLTAVQQIGKLIDEKKAEIMKAQPTITASEAEASAQEQVSKDPANANLYESYNKEMGRNKIS